MLLNKRLLVVVLVAVLVAGLLVGLGNGDEAVAKEPRATIGKIVVPAAAFIPTTDNWNYDSVGWSLGMVSGSGGFTAPLSFPVPVVNIRRVTLSAYDNSGVSSACLHLERAKPLTAGSTSMMPELCTADSTDHPEKVTTTAIDPRRINTVNHGPFLLVWLGPNTGLYGVQVVYSY